MLEELTRDQMKAKDKNQIKDKAEDRKFFRENPKCKDQTNPAD